jgi:hypothetical protein
MYSRMQWTGEEVRRERSQIELPVVSESTVDALFFSLVLKSVIPERGGG